MGFDGGVDLSIFVVTFGRHWSMFVTCSQWRLPLMESLAELRS